MSIFKQFNTNEVVITPFYANKGFRFVGSQITASDVGIEYYQSMQGPYVTGSHPTGFTTILDEVLVFNNVKQLYYSNYLTASTGDNFSTQSLIPGATPEYDSYVGITTGPRFDNFLQSSIQQDRQFSQFSSSTELEGPSIISVPSKLFGEKIPPSTFNFIYTSSVSPFIESFVYDDSEGNLLATQSNPNGDIVYTGSVGQIFYSQGMAVLTGVDSGNLSDFAAKVGSNGVQFGALISGLSVLGTTSGAAKTAMGSVAGPFTVTPSSTVTGGTLQNGVGASFSLTNDTTGEFGVGTALTIPASPAVTVTVGGTTAALSTTSSGLGSGAKIVVESSDGIKVTGATISAAGSGGSGYAIGDTITVSQTVMNTAGNLGTVGSDLNITIVSGDLENGVLTAISIVAPGAYYVVSNSITITQAELIAAGFIGAVGDLAISLSASRIVTPNSNIDSSSLAFSSSITIRENQYKCTVRDNEYSYTTNPSSLKPTGQLSPAYNQLFSSQTLSTYTNAGTPGEYVLAYSDLPSNNIGIGEEATATVTIDATGFLILITTASPGRGYNPGDTIRLDMAQTTNGSQIVPGGVGYVDFLLTSDDVFYQSNKNNQGEVYYDYATGSYFSPYVTTIGLYNDSYQLVAVGKLAQPIPISLYTDTTFIVNFDT